MSHWIDSIDRDIVLPGGHACFLDLGYPLNSDTIYWPGGEGFKLCMSCSTVTVDTSGGPTVFDYAAGTFSCAEHGGTHVDAPFHFNKNGQTIDNIGLKELIAPCRVIDVSDKCDMDRDYRLSFEDILDHERALGSIIEQGTIVIIRTGINRGIHNVVDLISPQHLRLVQTL